MRLSAFSVLAPRLPLDDRLIPGVAEDLSAFSAFRDPGEGGRRAAPGADEPQPARSSTRRPGDRPNAPRNFELSKSRAAVQATHIKCRALNMGSRIPESSPDFDVFQTRLRVPRARLIR
jgi:hypothetical protein